MIWDNSTYYASLSYPSVFDMPTICINAGLCQEKSSCGEVRAMNISSMGENDEDKTFSQFII
jgi:hypothetical protein